jgi:outer membrane protein assembly factor BamA
MDYDWRYYIPKIALGNMAFRFATSFGKPFTSQNQTLPFEKAYYGGGANDIRGWIARSLGPGSYGNALSIDQTGDIKLIMSAEYRFDIYWIFQGAFFTDAGNIWLWNPDANRPGANFNGATFYQQIAVGAGFGLRLNFNFFVVRFDEAWAVYDPTQAPNSRLYKKANEYNLRRMRINIGIGFPF